MLTEEIGKAISQRRKKLGLELSDLSDYSGVTISLISNIENGKANPTLKTLEKIIKPLGLIITTDIAQTSYV